MAINDTQVCDGNNDCPVIFGIAADESAWDCASAGKLRQSFSSSNTIKLCSNPAMSILHKIAHVSQLNTH